MGPFRTKGQCKYCKKEYAQTGITRHLQSCKERQKVIKQEIAQSKRLVPIYHLRIQGTHLPFYWLNVEIAGKSTLAELDQFLRDIWVECCGHLSAFQIKDQNYMSHAFDDVIPYAEKDEVLAEITAGLEADRQELKSSRAELDPFTLKMVQRLEEDLLQFDIDMSGPLNELLTEDTTFDYRYDFGSTTYLDLRVIEIRQGRLKKGQVNIIARNNPPDFPCEVCGKPTTQLCPECLWYGEGYFCNVCAKKHEHYSEYGEFMPLPNSPRAGVCGYDGT